MNKFFIVALLVAPVWAFAFRLDPMVADLEPTGPHQSKVFRVENNGQEKIAVQLKMTTRKIDGLGKETRESTSDFSVYPEQISLGPNDVRNVRVTYKGPPTVASETAYRLIASQLPVEFQKKKNETQLNFLFEYVASVYVRPENAAAKLVVQSVEAPGGNKVLLVLKNSGTAHRLLRGVNVNLANESGKSFSIKEASLQNWPSENILAGSERSFEIETKESIPAKTRLKASLQILDRP